MVRDTITRIVVEAVLVRHLPGSQVNVPDGLAVKEEAGNSQVVGVCGLNEITVICMAEPDGVAKRYRACCNARHPAQRKIINVDCGQGRRLSCDEENRVTFGH